MDPRGRCDRGRRRAGLGFGGAGRPRRLVQRRRQADHGLRWRRRRGGRGDPGRRQDRGRRKLRRQLRARSLRRRRRARPLVLGRWPGDDGPRWHGRRAGRGDPDRRQDRGRGQFGRELRAGPLHRRRRARPVVQRRWTADDRLRLRRTAPPRWRSRPTAGSWSGGSPATISRWPATTPAGGLDPSFSGDGKQTTDFGGIDSSNDVAIGADGTIVVVGTHASPTAVRRTSPWRATPPAVRSTEHRTATTDFGCSHSTYDSGEGVAIQADGRIVVVGYGAEQTQFGGYYTRDLQLARYETNGALDRSFSDDGRLETSFVCGHVGLWRGAGGQRQDRDLREGRRAPSRSPASTPTARSTPRSPTTASRPPRPRSPGDDEVGVDGVLQADGKLVVVGTTAAGDFTLARFHGDAPDPNPPGPTTPQTQITGGPSGPTNVTSPSYRFTATLAGSTFECKLDGPGAATGTYTSCASPKAYGPLTDGRYTFSVRATRSGITDPTPATRPFTVDTVAPGLVYDAVPPATSSNPWAQLWFHSTEPDSTFMCELGFTETRALRHGAVRLPEGLPVAPSWRVLRLCLRDRRGGERVGIRRRSPALDGRSRPADSRRS